MFSPQELEDDEGVFPAEGMQWDSWSRLTGNPTATSKEGHLACEPCPTQLLLRNGHPAEKPSQRVTGRILQREHSRELGRCCPGAEVLRQKFLSVPWSHWQDWISDLSPPKGLLSSRARSLGTHRESVLRERPRTVHCSCSVVNTFR